MAATGSASHSRPSTTGAAPRLRDFNRASLSAIRSARSAKSWSSSIIGARAASTTTTARHATQAVAIPIQMSIFTSSMLLLCTRLGVNALFKGTGPVGDYRCRFRSPHSLSLYPAHCRSCVYFATRTLLSQVRYCCRCSAASNADNRAPHDPPWIGRKSSCVQLGSQAYQRCHEARSIGVRSVWNRLRRKYYFQLLRTRAAPCVARAAVRPCVHVQSL